VKAMINVQERWKGQFRSIYEILWEDPRILNRNITSKIGKDTGKILKEASEYQYIIGPQARKRSYQNLKEYVCFVKSEASSDQFLDEVKNEVILYHAEMIGFSNLWIVAGNRIKVEGEVLAEGFRSDYYISHPPDHSWETAIEIMKKKIEIFKSQYAIPRNYIQTHFDKTIKWTPEDELLYRYFKYDLRKPLTPVMRDQNISKNKIYNFLERLPETCTIELGYYPDSLSAYDPYLFMFETDYEDFIVELFSELPTTSSFFKVSDKLLVYVHVAKKFARKTNVETAMNKLHIPLLINDLIKKNIVKSGLRAIIEYSWGKEL
jgi:hypothetical protein